MNLKKKPIDKILISACFLGKRVRYNGIVQTLESKLLQQWQAEGRLFSICPEVISGLPVPRPPAEINQLTKKVITIEFIDVTSQFANGANQALLLCQQHNIQFALLKESSPSCGSNTIYDGTFSQKKIAGEGLTTQLLRQHGIKVFCEDSIEELAELINCSDPTS
ncbi:DUF523 domain-containing protein [Colwellia sp. 12G3]|uniref:DUF523 domain-containing protein n=1 Tax=Colwellia sp. 12G3 TaxID=2058299 RepID=UPI000C336A83|nr:DUF523 domain-containing protein [Colwellia sp. 12G3]PKI17783.1 DUF523 domain-containing protein [Colwellia sp. 12G3]